MYYSLTFPETPVPAGTSSVSGVLNGNGKRRRVIDPNDDSPTESESEPDPFFPPTRKVSSSHDTVSIWTLLVTVYARIYSSYHYFEGKTETTFNRSSTSTRKN